MKKIKIENETVSRIRVKQNNKEILRIDRDGDFLCISDFRSLNKMNVSHIDKNNISTLESVTSFFSFEGFTVDVKTLPKNKKENNFSVVYGENYKEFFSAGKVYNFVDGDIVWDNGDKNYGYKFKSFEDLWFRNETNAPVFEVKKVKRQAKVGEYVQVVGGIKSTNKEGKTTQSGDICIQSKNHYGGYYGSYERFKNIDNDMEIMLTNMYNNTPEYLVLEGYEKYIEYIEKKKKAEFKPHLISSFSGSFYGNIGKESSQVDVLGNRLNVGDTVDLYCGTEPRYETSVVKYANVKTDFIMGLNGIIFSNGKCGDWTIVKKRSYEDVQDGETVGSIKYIKNDPSKAKISTYKY